MPVGETIAEQGRRSLLSVRAVATMMALCEYYKSLPPDADTSEVLAPGLLLRVVRKRTERNLSITSVAQLLSCEVSKARKGPLVTLAWLVDQLEYSLTRDPASLLTYLCQHRSSLPKGREEALLLLSTSVDAEPNIREQILHRLGKITGARSLVGYSDASFAGQIFTRNQRSILVRLLEMADVFYFTEATGPIRPRLFPLLIGPTGAGKSHIVKAIATQLGCDFLSITAGDWIVQGATADYEPSVYLILERVAKHDRVLLFLDELDKLRAEWDSSWARSVCTDIWRVLDHQLPTAAYLKSARSTLAEVTLSNNELQRRVPRSLWIVAAGTWQSLFTTHASIGFQSGSRTSAPTVSSATIAASQTIPVELLRRFHPEVLQLQYPGPEETSALYDASGLTMAANEVGLALDPARHDWNQGGMRSLEAIWTEVAILRRRRSATLSSHEKQP